MNNFLINNYVWAEFYSAPGVSRLSAKYQRMLVF